jgi:predicted amidohydrolase
MVAVSVVLLVLVVAADAHTTCTASGAGNVTCESWASGQSLNVTFAAPPVTVPPPLFFIDVQATAYSLPPPTAALPRNATVASIVSGAANPHNITPDEALAMAVAAAKHSPHPLDVVLFPECFLYDGYNAEACGVGGGPPGERWECKGPHVTACRRVAKATKAYVVCPFYELQNASASQDAGPSFNTAVLLDRTGAVVGKYRKSYPTSEIFPPNTGELSEGILPGNLGVPVFDTDFGRISLLICWDFDFPELWYAAAAGGAELVLWPSAGKGGQNVAVHAQMHNMFVAANGNGQNFDRLGRPVPADVSFNYTLPQQGGGQPDEVECFHPPCKQPRDGRVLINVATLDLDSSLIFSGGPGPKKKIIEAFIADGEKHGVASVYQDDVANLQLLACVRPGCHSRTALREAGLETRREERSRNRLSNNLLRQHVP